MKHTPGPWKLGTRKDGSMWMSLGDPASGRHSQFNFDGFEDDGRLMISAPDMYEALTEAVQLALQDPAALSPLGRDIIARWEAALAKAGPAMRDKVIEIIARQLCALAFDANEGGTFSYKVVDERWRDWAPDASVAYDALEAAGFAVVPVSEVTKGKPKDNDDASKG